MSVDTEAKALRIKPWDVPTFRHLKTENESTVKVQEDMEVGISVK